MSVFVPASVEELAMIERMKERLKLEAPDLGFTFTDTSILRFYRGRKQDEVSTFRGLLRHVKWRNENKVDEIMQNPDKFATEMNCNKLTVGEHKDKEGRPVVYIYAGRHNKDSRDIDEVRMLIIYTIETVMKQVKPEEERLVIAFDLSQFSYTCMDYEVLNLLIKILQFNYPETLAVALVVDSPFYFSACWAIIRPWLDPVTAAKALFISRAQLVDYFEPSSLPDDLKIEAAAAASA